MKISTERQPCARFFRFDVFVVAADVVAVVAADVVAVVASDVVVAVVAVAAIFALYLNPPPLP